MLDWLTLELLQLLTQVDEDLEDVLLVQRLLLPQMLADRLHVLCRHRPLGPWPIVAAVDTHVLKVECVAESLARWLVGVDGGLKGLALHLLLGRLELLDRVPIVRLKLPYRLEVA